MLVDCHNRTLRKLTLCHVCSGSHLRRPTAQRQHADSAGGSVPLHPLPGLGTLPIRRHSSVPGTTPQAGRQAGRSYRQLFKSPLKSGFESFSKIGMNLLARQVVRRWAPPAAFSGALSHSHLSLFAVSRCAQRSRVCGARVSFPRALNHLPAAQVFKYDDH